MALKLAGTFSNCAIPIEMSAKTPSPALLLRAVAGLASAWLAFPAFAQEAQTLPLTTITHVADADELPYSDFLVGMDTFQRDHALAPDATLRFTIVPRSPNIDPKSIELRLVDVHDDSQSPVDISVDEHGNFDVPRVDRLMNKGATIRSNLPAGALHWRPLVATPGVPPDARRLGDLRLECEVKEAGGLNRPDIPFIGRIFGNPGSKECFTDDEHVFLAPAPLRNVVVEAPQNQVQLPASRIAESSTGAALPRLYTVFEPYLRPRAFSPPLQDPAIPNDALVRFQFVDGNQPQALR
jgi:hypothetical protein